MKKRIVRKILSLSLIAVVLTGCGADSSVTESTEASGTKTSGTETTSEGIVSVNVITNVYGDGQKVAAVVVEYGENMDASSLDTSDYQIISENVTEVEEYTITDIYTNSEIAMTDSQTEGNYVVIEVSTDYTLSGYGTSEDSFGGGIGTSKDGESTSNVKGGRSFGNVSSESNNLQIKLIQTGDVSSKEGNIYAAGDTEYKNDISTNVNLLVDNFEQLVFTSADGTELMYNLYLPDDYDESVSYPIVLFMPDATGTSSDPYRTLTQGLRAVIWASEESQEENSAIVLAPQYESTNESADITMELLEAIVAEYSVNSSRVYLTGQSAGTIRSIEMMIENPDYFAGAMLVAGQAGNEYTDRLAELANQNIWMITSTGDAKAFPGMTAIMEAVEDEGTVVTEGAWSALDSEESRNEAAQEMKNAGTTFYFTVLSDVVPERISDSDATEHMNTWRVAYSISEIRNWLFEQVNE